MALKRFFHQLHYRPLPVWTYALLPLEWGYRMAAQTRAMLYRQRLLGRLTANVPIISVGNLTTGGTGKTPIVMAVARGLIQAGKTVVILSRGYGARKPVPYARALDPDYGDEAWLMQEQVPEAVVIVGQNRALALEKAITDYRPDIVLLDDGYQTLRIDRTVNILLVDGERLFGNNHLLPLGPLREPVREMRRADLIIVTKAVPAEGMAQVERWTRRHHPGVQVLPVAFRLTGLQRATDHGAESLELLKGKPVVAISGIAQPERLEQDLAQAGISLEKHWAFADHYNYRRTDVDRILDNVPADALLVTTGKDRAKLMPLLPEAWRQRLYVLKNEPTLDGRWFYHEFLSQMPALRLYEKGAPAHSR